METPREYYYTYYSYEEWGRGYFGSRGCKCLPEKDVKYFGSSKDKTFRPTQKIILKGDYITREEAYADEIILQQYYKVVENPHFANRSYQTSVRFSMKGTTPWNKGIPRDPEIIKKMNDARRGKPPHNKGKKLSEEQKHKLSASCKGRKLSEETKEKISKAIKGRELSESHKRKIGESNKGKPRHTEESKERLRKMQQDRKEKPGKPHSDATKEKISKATKGRIPWNKGIKNPEVCGGKNPRAKRIEFEGTIYECIKDALKSTGRSRQYVLKYATYL
jgi:hypothetical protein